MPATPTPDALPNTLTMIGHDDVQVLLAAAREAESAGSDAVAAEMYEAVRKACPLSADGYLGAFRSLRKLGRESEAEAVLATGTERIPQNADIAGNYGWLAHNRQDWGAAAQRWERYREYFGDQALGYNAGSIVLQELRRFDEADELLRQAMAEHSSDAELLGNYAWVAHRRCCWEEALIRWHTYLMTFPQHVIGASSTSIVLCELKRFDEADAVLETALKLHPDNQELLGNYAWAAHRREDWSEALVRWTKLRHLFPNEKLGHEQVVFVLRELGRFAESDLLLSQISNNGSLANFFLGFESLGDNCEFGRVQSHFGAEPLGLLRFAATAPDMLIAALREKLEGVGRPENTVLSIHDGYYWVSDKRYGMSMNTFKKEENSKTTDHFKKFCRRLEYLRDKILIDLSEGNKYFVYRSGKIISDDIVKEISNQLQSYGRNRLLLIMPADISGLIEPIKILNDVIIVGYISDSSVELPLYERWLHICEKANLVWSQSFNIDVQRVKM